MTVALNRERAKIKFIRDLLDDRLRRTHAESVIVTFSELQRIPLLKDEMGFRHTLKTICESSGGHISFREAVEAPLVGKLHERAANPYPDPIPPAVIGYEIHVANPSKIDEHFRIILDKEKDKKIVRRKNPPYFREVTVGELRACADNRIRFKGQVIKMRPQVATLCWLLMDSVGALITYDDIRDRIIASKKRATTSNTTIAKYVSELQVQLEKAYGHEVIFNVRSEGWRFEPEREAQ
jgi:hypothetical protein